MQPAELGRVAADVELLAGARRVLPAALAPDRARAAHASRVAPARRAQYLSYNALANVAALRRIALGIIKANTAKGSNRVKLKKVGWSNDFLRTLIEGL